MKPISIYTKHVKQYTITYNNLNLFSASATVYPSCNIPSLCTAGFGRKSCGSNDTIPKGSRCDTTTTSPEPTTTTPKPTTTTRVHHGHCWKRHHRHP